MNNLMLVALAVVLLCYCGGRFCPSVLKQNKEVVLGVLVGMALSSFAGLKLEGAANLGKSCSIDSDCNSGHCNGGVCVEMTKEHKDAQRTHNLLCSNPDLKNWACSGGPGSDPDFWNTECPQNRCP